LIGACGETKHEGGGAKSGEPERIFSHLLGPGKGGRDSRLARRPRACAVPGLLRGQATGLHGLRAITQRPWTGVGVARAHRMMVSGYKADRWRPKDTSPAGTRMCDGSLMRRCHVS
jgi:hypothetical protein